MRILVTGGSGLLGGALVRLLCKNHDVIDPSREEFDLRTAELPYKCDLAFFCAGTKGFAECEGNAAVFQADVDGNIRHIRHLQKLGVFVVFVSTDAVEKAQGAAYARNRFLVEMAVGHLPNVAIFRPAKFFSHTVEDVAVACAKVGLDLKEGLTRWP